MYANELCYENKNYTRLESIVLLKRQRNNLEPSVWRETHAYSIGKARLWSVSISKGRNISMWVYLSMSMIYLQALQYLQIDTLKIWTLTHPKLCKILYMYANELCYENKKHTWLTSSFEKTAIVFVFCQRLTKGSVSDREVW